MGYFDSGFPACSSIQVVSFMFIYLFQTRLGLRMKLLQFLLVLFDSGQYKFLSVFFFHENMHGLGGLVNFHELLEFGHMVFPLFFFLRFFLQSPIDLLLISLSFLLLDALFYLLVHDGLFPLLLFFSFFLHLDLLFELVLLLLDFADFLFDLLRLGVVLREIFMIVKWNILCQFAQFYILHCSFHTEIMHAVVIQFALLHFSKEFA